MPSAPFHKLVELFSLFPGIGRRQAERFTYFLLRREPALTSELIATLSNLREETVQCEQCFRYFAKNGGGTLCDICRDPNRDATVLMIVEKDVDVEAVRRAGVYQGRYFVLGGLVPILAKNPEQSVRSAQLIQTIKRSLDAGPLTEIIIAVSANPEGDNTVEYLRDVITPAVSTEVKISVLGRGLSTGTELEYSDAETIKHALGNRK